MPNIEPPKQEVISSGMSDSIAMQWAQRQLNSLEGELKLIEQQLNAIDKTNALHDRDISDLKQNITNRFDKLEALLEKNATKVFGDLEKVENRIAKTLEEHKTELKSLNRLTNRYVGGLSVLVFVIGIIGLAIRYWPAT